jgi:hypothetical protein
MVTEAGRRRKRPSGSIEAARAAAPPAPTCRIDGRTAADGDSNAGTSRTPAPTAGLGGRIRAARGRSLDPARVGHLHQSSRRSSSLPSMDHGIAIFRTHQMRQCAWCIAAKPPRIDQRKCSPFLQSNRGSKRYTATNICLTYFHCHKTTVNCRRKRSSRGPTTPLATVESWICRLANNWLGFCFIRRDRRAAKRNGTELPRFASAPTG